ncbi:MAG: N-acetylneuraminate synthase family protein [Methanoregula sp.]|uniref:N-acetylneuraminate synthase family protein n=1 Tax=Methanoregula sp. TaxID=2052170 RepID=UPI0025FEBB70|nr:N-acetylneuraminate synthase family protein [Methanoregula sp.]MCK9631767.1 N-acetylneuraminate synthase family protein [Methanoregula sp.]
MYIIAEIGQAHEGSLGIAHSYIDALAETGVDAVKFQVHIADAESSVFEPFRVNFSYEDQTRYDYWKRMEFTTEQWTELKKHCEKKGLNFIPSTFSNASVDMMEQIGVGAYKIGSGEVNNFLMLQKIARTGKPVYLSSGMSSFSEIDSAVELLKHFKNPLTILQCTSAYPAKPQDWGLNVIPELKERYHVPVGYSDHSGDIYACLAATTLGAEVLEFHVVFDKRMFGPDTCASLTIDQVKMVVTGSHDINVACNSRIDKNVIITGVLKKIFEKSLAINRDLKSGEIISEDILESKKPKNCGIDAREYQKVLGRSLKNDLKKGNFLKESDLNEKT